MQKRLLQWYTNYKSNSWRVSVYRVKLRAQWEKRLISNSRCSLHTFSFFFFLNDPAPTEIYPLPLHHALPISLQARRLPPGVPLHIVDDAAHPIGVGADDLGQAPLFLGQTRGFRQQLSGVTHGSDGVADLVGDARAQASEGCELGLLDLLAEEAGVREEDQQRPRVRGCQWREARPHDPRTVGGDECRVLGGQCLGASASLAPGLQ